MRGIFDNQRRHIHVELTSFERVNMEQSLHLDDQNFQS